MTKQERNVLDALHYFGGSATEGMLADRAGYPRPSIRRTLQQLMHQGEHISFARDGYYSIEKPEQPSDASYGRWEK